MSLPPWEDMMRQHITELSYTPVSTPSAYTKLTAENREAKLMFFLYTHLLVLCWTSQDKI